MEDRPGLIQGFQLHVQVIYFQIQVKITQKPTEEDPQTMVHLTKHNRNSITGFMSSSNMEMKCDIKLHKHGARSKSSS